MPRQTIAAPATPRGVSALAVIRISGAETRVVGEKILSPFKNIPNQMYRTKLINPFTQELLDDVMACFFVAPKSYTGEDSLELFVHGNPLLVQSIMAVITELPKVRWAQPGEFTQRSFFNGKLDLIQAEAVGELLHATAEQGIKNAQKMLRGDLSADVAQITAEVKKMSALLELDVDFAEEELDVDQSAWMPQLEIIEQSLKAIQQKFREKYNANKVPQVVIYGAPNAGKSSLINALLKEERILVSAQAGTTRDAVQVRLLLDQGEVELVDTAGISARPKDELDALAQQKTHEVLAQAEHAICVIDGCAVEEAESQAQVQKALEQKHSIVWTKKDLLKNENHPYFKEGLLTSSHNAEGLTELLQHLNANIFGDNVLEDEYWIANARQIDDLKDALYCLEKSREALVNHPHSPEIIAFEFMGVRNALRRLIGEICSDDVVGAIL